jgi:hypothetical protein
MTLKFTEHCNSRMLNSITGTYVVLQKHVCSDAFINCIHRSEHGLRPMFTSVDIRTWMFIVDDKMVFNASSPTMNDIYPRPRGSMVL